MKLDLNKVLTGCETIHRDGETVKEAYDYLRNLTLSFCNPEAIRMNSESVRNTMEIFEKRIQRDYPQMFIEDDEEPTPILMLPASSIQTGEVIDAEYEVIQDIIPDPTEEVEVSSETPDSQSATMRTPQDPDKIELAGGITIDMGQMNQDPIDPSNPSRIALQQRRMGMVNQDGSPSIIQPMPIPGPVQPVIYGAPPIHKIDEQPKVKPQVADVDHVEAKGFDHIDISGLKEPPAVYVKPETIKDVPPDNTTPQEVQRVEKNAFDNSEAFNKFPKLCLDVIQGIANANNHHVRIWEYPAEGIISVVTHNADMSICEAKSFCIDSGNIIDPRIKLIVAVPALNAESILEFGQMFEVFSQGKELNRKAFDTKLFEDIFFAGVDNIGKKPMYTERYMALNRKLMLISLPTRKINKEQRNALQNYILKMDEDGYFDKALSIAPGSRFAFVEKVLDPNHLSKFSLVNDGIQPFYGIDPYPGIQPVIIQSDENGIIIKAAGNSAAPEVTPMYPPQQ